MIKIGSHVNMSGNDMFLGSVKEALSYGANAFMIYTGAPQNTRRKALDKMKIKEAHVLLNENKIALDDIVVHAPYIMNLANPDPVKHQFAIDFLTSEINRTYALGIKQIVLHPGAHVGSGEKDAINRIIKGLNQVIENTFDKDVKIALETMAGKGTEVGKSFEELANIITGVTHNERLSVCFDTCHTHDYGYPVKENFEQVINDFDKIIGKNRISVFHINDSKNPSGARKDRHQNIGFGHIGFDSLNEIVHHPDFTKVPKILETPHILIEDKKSLPPYLEEITNFRNKLFKIDGILKKI
ncbi:deoxyribonuclease IV [Mycoplasmatota bacterium]|nr:deoxyribonuclease IV [Mycoplasmatota bacterium]